MSLSDSSHSTTDATDADLVAACMAGDRHAFGRIVQRYQRLLCSLAYCATGSVSESEDVAQEAFVTAWQQLRELREPEKLRSWLCGILRFKISRLRRREDREPVSYAESIEGLENWDATEETATHDTMHKEEEAILWAELARVPPIYREPLVLYYREHRSVEHVATALDITEEAVKQRLARGRKILQERVLSFVESALARSTPGKVFTLGVLAALPEFAGPAKAAGIGVAAAHGGAMAKTTSMAAFLVSTMGITNFVLTMRGALDQSRTPRERREVVAAVVAGFGLAMVFLLVIYGMREAAFRWPERRELFAWGSQLLILAGIVAWPLANIWSMRRLRRIRSEERRLQPSAFAHPRDHVGSAAGEYKSRLKLFGVPLVHVRFALADEGAPPLFAWIAGGDRAYGLLFAWGQLAVAPISVGVVSAGILAIGALSFGLVGLGTVGIGVLAVGCITVGVKAYAWISALGWETASSQGFGIARLAAEAPIAIAQHVNDPIARELLAHPHAERNQIIFFTLIAVFSMVPLIYFVGEVRRRLGSKTEKAVRNEK